MQVRNPYQEDHYFGEPQAPRPNTSAPMYRPSVPQPGDDPQDLTSYPASVQQHLYPVASQQDLMLSQMDTLRATQVEALRATNSLAFHAPDAAAAVLMAAMGKSQIQVNGFRQEVTQIVEPRKVLGIHVGEDVTTRSVTHVEFRTITIK